MYTFHVTQHVADLLLVSIFLLFHLPDSLLLNFLDRKALQREFFCMTINRICLAYLSCTCSYVFSHFFCMDERSNKRSQKEIKHNLSRPFTCLTWPRKTSETPFEPHQFFFSTKQRKHKNNSKPPLVPCTSTHLCKKK